MQKILCKSCGNYIGDLKCLAFLTKIPTEILTRENNHIEPLNNQGNNIVFEEKK